MNQIILSGRLTKENELRFSNSTSILKNTIAVRRNFKSPDGNYDSDFVNITAFGKTADYLDKYSGKGCQVLIRGRIQTGSYENKSGDKIYTTDVIVDEVNLFDRKPEKEKNEDTIYISDIDNFLE
jgi:single-strand DNA-binding protein